MRDHTTRNVARYLKPSGNLGARKQKPSNDEGSATEWTQHAKSAQRARGWQDAHSVNNATKQGYACN